MLNISSPFMQARWKNHIPVSFYSIPQYHNSICAINNTLSSVKMKSLLFFSKGDHLLTMCDPQIHFSLLTSLVTIPSIIFTCLPKAIKSSLIFFFNISSLVKISQTAYLEGHLIGTFGAQFLSPALLWGRLNNRKEGKTDRQKGRYGLFSEEN